MLRNALSLLLLASAQAVTVVVTCPNTPNSFTVDGVENGNVTVNAGDIVSFNVACTSGFQLINSVSGAVLTSGVSPTTPVTDGVLVLNTSFYPAPVVLLYRSPSEPAMNGTISVLAAPATPATPPSITSVAGVLDVPNLIITWAPGTAGSCIFASWDLQFVTGGSGSVPGCSNLTSVAGTSCQATLNGNTTYSFTVQRLCTNPLANSDISTASTPITVGKFKTCQNVNTCDCGAVDSCKCESTQVCNCQRADRCICQGGECNGGHAKKLICTNSTGCNMECALDCNLCGGGGLNINPFSDDSCSAAGVVHASLALLAVLFAFSW